MTEQTDAAEVAEIIHRALEPTGVEDAPGCPEDEDGFVGCFAAAAAVLASDWLAAREAAAEVRGAQAVLAAVEPIHTAWEPTGFRYTDGRQIPVCTVDEEVFPCSTLRAARAAAAAAGGGGARPGPGEPPDDELAYGSRTGR